jgi:hypothetical protein
MEAENSLPCYYYSQFVFILVLGGTRGFLDVFDNDSATFTHSCCTREDSDIYDLVVIDENQFLLASSKGLLKSTKD